uniref:BTB domain-containing protein n=1 Tax=Cuerna arida TaxID=1464854 RepID=A0A1B6GFX9_9HEMI
MLERVVGRMFRAATSRPENCSNSVNMDASTSHDSSNVQPAQNSRLQGDVEIDNSDHVLLKIATLYAERLMSDVTLVVGGVEYPAHRLILCASSEVFQVMLMSPSWSESHESRVVLQESGPCSNIFGEFLRYFYTGQIRINQHTIMPVLLLADKYNVKDLTVLCGQYMCDHIANAATSNQLITWFQYALSLGHYQVAQACENFVKWNLELVARASDFMNFQQDVFIRILQQSDLVVHNEMTVYNIVVQWLEAQSLFDEDLRVEEDMFTLMKQVMEHVRFPMMSPRQLAELLLSPLTKAYKEFFIERMAIGMSYHSNQTDRILQICQMEGGRLMFTPRLYTADRWCSLLTVENFSQLQPYHTRTLVFSSQAVVAEYAGEKTCDWVIDLYPKGVWFRKFFLIVWQGTMEVPECVLRTVRVSVTCREFPNGGEDFRARIGLLITGMQDGVEHTMMVYQRCHRFSQEDKVLHLDDIVDYDDLNETFNKQSSFLVGEDRDVFKINIVITPLTDFCYPDDYVPIEMLAK